MLHWVYKNKNNPFFATIHQSKKATKDTRTIIKINMKKILATLIVLSTFLWFAPSKIAHATDTWYFRVTAYYSPLPNQSAYIMGTYALELRMNGMWIAGASGKPVFAWMLAAPKNYAFGTKIQLDWIWVGEVADRGGAIVPAWERWFKHDRIDVWMWHGEEWLRRAMYWGNRVIKWRVIAPEADVSINLANHPAPLWATNHLKKAPSSIYQKAIGKHSPVQDIQELQRMLKKQWLYSWAIDWDYLSIQDIIYIFQMIIHKM